MELREKAIFYMEKFHKNKPIPIMQRISKEENGIGFLLSYLYANSSIQITAGDLAKNLEVSTARIAVLLRKMEERGYVHKSFCESDGRKTIITITEDGKLKVKKQKEKMLDLMEKIIIDVGEEDLDYLFQILEKLNSSIERNCYND